MLKFLGKFFIFITIVAALTALLYLQFYYRGIHLITQPLNKSDQFKSFDGSDFSIIDITMKMTSWDSTEANLIITIYNNGKNAAPNSYDVNATFVSNTNAITMIATDTDTKEWDAGTLTTLVFPVDTAVIGYGQSSLYLRIWDDSTKSIVPIDNRLNCEKNGYFLGSVSILHGIINF